MKILITGIGGHLGGRFATWLRMNKPDVEIVGIDNFSCGYPENVPKDITVYKATLGTDHVNSWLFDNVDYVYHFAAYAAEGLSPFIRHFDTQNNLLSTIDVLNTCLNVGSVKRIIFTSSMSVYGNGKLPFDESSRRAPIDAYGISKSACEQHLETAYAQHRQGYCIIRPHNIYGPHQSGWQVFRNVLAYWMARAKQGLPILVYGDGLQTRAFSYIDDMLEPLYEAAVNPDAGQQIINLGGREHITILAAANLVSEITGAKVEHVEARHEVKNAFCTVDKSIGLLGYRETVNLEEGLLRMWKWTGEAWDKYPQRRGTHKIAEIEVRKGLYSFWEPWV
jgi:UDP-glucose 4-epimerase